MATISNLNFQPGPPFYNAKHKAIADGSTDVTSELQSALDEATGTGGRLVMGQGTFIHGAELTVSGASDFEIDGLGGTIKSDDGTTVATGYGGIRLTNCTDFTIRNLTIDLNRSGRTPAETPAHGIFLAGCQRFRVEECNIKNGVTDGIYITFYQSSSSVNVTGTSGGAGTNIVLTTDTHGLSNDDIVYVENISLSGGTGESSLNDHAWEVKALTANTLELLETSGITIGTYSSGGTIKQQTYTQDGSFVGCSLSNAYRNNMSIICGRRLTFTGCTFSDANGTNPQAGVDVEPNDSDADYATRDIQFLGCHFEGNTNWGLNVTGKSSGVSVVSCDITRSSAGAFNLGMTRHCRIINSHIYNMNDATRGLIDIGSGSSHVNVIGNIIESCQNDAGALRGIYSHSASDNVNISFNILRNINDVSGSLYAIQSASPNSIVNGNIVDTCRGISVGARCNLSNNILVNNIGRGIQIGGDDCIVEDNILYNTDMTGSETDGVIDDASAGSIIRGNVLTLSPADTGIRAIDFVDTPSQIIDNQITGFNPDEAFVFNASSDGVVIGINTGDHNQTNKLEQTSSYAIATSVTISETDNIIKITGTGTQLRNITPVTEGRYIELELTANQTVVHNFSDSEGDILFPEIPQAITNKAKLKQSGGRLGLRGVDVGGTLKWKVTYNDEYYSRSSSVAVIDFTLQMSNPQLDLTSTNAAISDATTAIDDGAYHGHRGRIFNRNTDTSHTITLQNGANTSWYCGDDLVIPSESFVDVCWDDTNSVWTDEIYEKPFSKVLSAGFTLTAQKPVLYLTSTAARTSDVTTAINDGSVVGQTVRLVNGNASGTYNIIIKDAANTTFVSGDKTISPAGGFVDMMWDGSNWLEMVAS